jgi:hypothetical protein
MNRCDKHGWQAEKRTSCPYCETEQKRFSPAPCSAWVVRKVDALFAGRKGHGGGKCCSRVLDANQLRELLQEAFSAGRAVRQRNENRPRRVNTDPDEMHEGSRGECD